MSRPVADEISEAIDRRISTLVQSTRESLDGCSYDHRYTERHAETASDGLKLDVERLIRKGYVAEVAR